MLKCYNLCSFLFSIYSLSPFANAVSTWVNTKKMFNSLDTFSSPSPAPLSPDLLALCNGWEWQLRLCTLIFGAFILEYSIAIHIFI